MLFSSGGIDFLRSQMVVSLRAMPEVEISQSTYCEIIGLKQLASSSSCAPSI
jgi:hypothetical protein